MNFFHKNPIVLKKSDFYKKGQALNLNLNPTPYTPSKMAFPVVSIPFNEALKVLTKGCVEYGGRAVVNVNYFAPHEMKQIREAAIAGKVDLKEVAFFVGAIEVTNKGKAFSDDYCELHF